MVPSERLYNKNSGRQILDYQRSFLQNKSHSIPGKKRKLWSFYPKSNAKLPKEKSRLNQGILQNTQNLERCLPRWKPSFHYQPANLQEITCHIGRKNKLNSELKILKNF